MEAYPPPHLFGSGDVCQQIIRASIRDYFSRDLFYGRLMGLQVCSKFLSIIILDKQCKNDVIKQQWIA